MREDLIRRYAPQLGITNLRPRSGGGWMECPCILAPWTHDSGHDSSPSAAIKINESGKSWYTCQACKHSVSFANLAFKLFGFTEDAAYQRIGYEIEQSETSTEAESLPDWDEEEHAESAIDREILPRSALSRFTLAYESQDCRDYLRSRRIKPYTALRLGLRYDYRDDRILFPVFDRHSEFRGFVGRAMYDDAPIRVKDYLGLNKVELMLGEHKVFKNRHRIKYVVVVEGPFDYANVLQAGYPVLGLFGSKITKPKFDKLVDLNLPIIWMVDNDEAGHDCIYGPTDKVTGQRETSKGALHLLNDYVPQLLVDYPRKKNDPGELSKKQIDRMVRGAELHLIAA